MNLEDVKKMIEAGEGNTTLSIKLPSTGITYQFNPITVGVRKTLAKYSLNEYSQDALLNFQVGKLALIKTLCTDERFDETSLSEIDFIYILACLRQFNILDDFTITAICPKCQFEISHNLDLDLIVKRCEDYKHFTTQVSKKDKKKNEWEFTLKDPTMYDVIILEKYLLDNDKDDSDRDLSRPFLYISSIKFNGEPIEDFSKLNAIEKISFLNGLDDRIIYGKKGITTIIEEKFVNNFKIYDSIKCTGKNCGYDLGGVVTSDSFFTF